MNELLLLLLLLWHKKTICRRHELIAVLLYIHSSMWLSIALYTSLFMQQSLRPQKPSLARIFFRRQFVEYRLIVSVLLQKRRALRGSATRTDGRAHTAALRSLMLTSISSKYRYYKANLCRPTSAQPSQADYSLSMDKSACCRLSN